MCRRIIHLNNINDLRNAASAWDDLWWRSDISPPTTRAEMLALWLEKFSVENEFHAFVVEEDGRWIAALPMISRRLAGFVEVGTLPCNPWSPCGDLLLDPTANITATMEELLSAVADVPWNWFWLNKTVLHSMRWKAFVHACDCAGMVSASQKRYQVARIEINSDWDSFLRTLSRSHRQTTNKAVERLNNEGPVSFQLQSHLERHEVKPWLEKVFAVEDHNWKGDAGSSVLRTPDMFDYFLAQAEQLAEWGQLEIATLVLNGHVIAGLYGFSAKGVFYAHKIGYDPQFSHFKLDQVLFWHLLERLHAAGQWQAVDCIGPLTESISRWRPVTYTIGRVVVAPPHLVGRAAMHAYKNWWPTVRRIRKKSPAKIPLQTKPANSPVPEPQGVPA